MSRIRVVIALMADLIPQSVAAISHSVWLVLRDFENAASNDVVRNGDTEETEERKGQKVDSRRVDQRAF